MEKQSVKLNGSTKPTPRPIPDDAVDISNLWVDDHGTDPLAASVLSRIPVGTPRDFTRVCPDRAYRRRGVLYLHKSENTIKPEPFLIAPAMQKLMSDDARPCIIVTCVDRAMLPRIWPLTLPRDTESDCVAWSTLRDIARQAMDCWVKPLWTGGRFVCRAAEQGYAPDPDFSRLPAFDELIGLAFGTHGVISDANHPIARALFGRPPVPSTGDLDVDPLC